MMKYFYLIVFVFIEVSVFGQWQQVGEKFGDANEGNWAALSFSPSSGELYTAYPDTTLQKFVVRKYNGTDWEPLGEAMGSILVGGTEIALSFNPTTNEPYVAYPDNELEAFVIQKYNGTSWETVGSTLGNIEGNPGIEIVFHPVTVEPYVGYPDIDSNAFVVQRYNGDEWLQVGTALGDASADGKVDMGFNPITDELYTSYGDEGVFAGVVEKFNGDDWEQVGENLSLVFPDAPISLSFNPTTGQAYIVYPHVGGNNFHVLKFEDDSWIWAAPFIAVGATSFAKSHSDIGFNSVDDNPFIAFLNYDAYASSTYNDEGLVEIGEEFEAAGEYDGITLAFHPSTNVQHICFRDKTSNSFVVYAFIEDLSILTKESHNIFFYPNPTRSDLTVKLANDYDNLSANIYTITGQLIIAEYSINGSSMDIHLPKESGLYIVEIMADKKLVKRIEVVKE